MKCDHCKVLVDVEHRPWDRFKVTFHSIFPREITLCRVCANEFITWLDGPC